ncbi:dihydropteroate synthase [Alkalitalea saponilacus]|uniref:dihydropteroate synthase n=1 Tax=Alkalitalea saponilacus TaxID=889453 RepID=A0A1T5H953_9BACT|nr:dihydropteroate synthase [Alkalitalea saponilacus]ASB50830.1 dihydropteroate synthase [Alkalitalea saponilacus]SKC17164.1 dihydropteroate synthase [Alkalitalea saponilacus]
MDTISKNITAQIETESFLKCKRYINCRGQLMDLSTPAVMGILNATPDSFYSGSRFTGEKEVLQRVEEILLQGGKMVDVGAYSSRPGAEHISEEEEINRLMPVLKSIRQKFPDIIISVDTFRSAVARKAIIEGEADIINDIAGGEMDDQMFATIASLKVPYILMHMQGTPQNMQQSPVYKDVVADVSLWLAKRVDALRTIGVADVIIDPGFGFGKTLNQNYILLNALEELALFELPLLVGLSRKSMIYRYFETDAESALNGTSVLNTIALGKGASILRVHDVKEAVECVKLFTKLKQ